MKIRAARSEDLHAIKTLLAENFLPTADIHVLAIGNFLVAEDATGAFAGCVGLEKTGPDALLRSLVVANSFRGKGLGRQLLATAEQFAVVERISDLWLLTTGASEFFQRAGYTVVDRTLAPAEIQASTQFSTLCPASATCLTHTVGSRPF